MFRRWIRLVADRPLSRHRRLDVDADRASNVVDRAFFHRRSIDASEVAFIRNTWSRRQSEPDPPVFPTRHPVATKRRLWKKRLQTSSKEHVFLARRGRSEATFVRAPLDVGTSLRGAHVVLFDMSSAVDEFKSLVEGRDASQDHAKKGATLATNSTALHNRSHVCCEGSNTDGRGRTKMARNDAASSK